MIKQALESSSFSTVEIKKQLILKGLTCSSTQEWFKIRNIRGEEITFPIIDMREILSFGPDEFIIMCCDEFAGTQA